MSKITVILTAYQRVRHLQWQINAIRAQTIAPAEVMLWANRGHTHLPSALADQCNTAICNTNHGVWARFAYALLAKTEYVAIFDDDTIPGKRWLENCQNTMCETPGLLGTRGLIFTNPDDYFANPICKGLYAPCATTERVDIVGHCWFFKREWLSTAFWRELPDLRYHNRVGEDMHFSYTIQKYLGLNTFVPPHPARQRGLWGSLQPRLGADRASIFRSDGPKPMREYLQSLRGRGFQLMCEMPSVTTKSPGEQLDLIT